MLFTFSFKHHFVREVEQKVYFSTFQNNPASKGRRGEEGDPVSLHRMALPLQPLQQRFVGVQTTSETSYEPASGDPGWSCHRPLQVRNIDAAILRHTLSVFLQNISQSVEGGPQQLILHNLREKQQNTFINF